MNMTRFYDQHMQDAYGCGRCPSVAPFAPRVTTPGVAGIVMRPLRGTSVIPRQTISPDWSTLPRSRYVLQVAGMRLRGMGNLGGVAWNDPQPAGQRIRTLFYVKVAGSAAAPYPRGTISGLSWTTRNYARVTQAASPLDQFTTYYIEDEWAVSGGLTPETIRSRVKAKYAAVGTVIGGGSVQVRVCSAGSCNWVTPVGTSTASGPAIAVPSTNPEAARLAQPLVTHLNAQRRNYDHNLVRGFQRAAGISADGIYGERTLYTLLLYVPSAPEVAWVNGGGGSTPGGSGGGGGGGGGTTPAPPAPRTPPASDLHHEEGVSLWGWIAAGVAVATVAIGISVARRG
jgi:hypothetical protein